MTTTADVSVTSGHAEFFVEHGYLVVPQLLTADEVEIGRDETLRFARGDYPLSNPPLVADDATDEERVGAMLAVHFPHWVSETSLALVHHPGVVDVLSKVTAAHLPFWDGRVKCMQSMLFLKPPGLQGQAWHQDERYIPTRDRSLIGAWLALDDADIENGCLWVLPGSHKMGYLYPTRDHGRRDEFDASDEAHGFDDRAAVAVEVQAGDVVFFNGYLLHRSFRNRSSRTRRALVNHYMNAWSNLPWMMGKGVDVGTEDYRMIVPVAGEDPHAWKGYTDPPKETFVRPHPGGKSQLDAQQHIDTEVHIAASIDVVWRALADLPAYGEWNPYVVRADGEPTVGAVVQITARPTGDAETTYPITVLGVDAPIDGAARMVWEGGMADAVQFRTEHIWELTSTDDGTHLRHHEYFRGALAPSILAERGDAIRADFIRFNESLRDRAETACE